jgi:hypothetical protein
MAISWKPVSKRHLLPTGKQEKTRSVVAIGRSGNKPHETEEPSSGKKKAARLAKVTIKRHDAMISIEACNPGVFVERQAELQNLLTDKEKVTFKQTASVQKLTTSSAREL